MAGVQIYSGFTVAPNNPIAHPKTHDRTNPFPNPCFSMNPASGEAPGRTGNSPSFLNIVAAWSGSAVTTIVAGRDIGTRNRRPVDSTVSSARRWACFPGKTKLNMYLSLFAGTGKSSTVKMSPPSRFDSLKWRFWSPSIVCDDIALLLWSTTQGILSRLEFILRKIRVLRQKVNLYTI